MFRSQEPKAPNLTLQIKTLLKETSKKFVLKTYAIYVQGANVTISS